MAPEEVEDFNNKAVTSVKINQNIVTAGHWNFIAKYLYFQFYFVAGLFFCLELFIPKIGFERLILYIVSPNKINARKTIIVFVKNMFGEWYPSFLIYFKQF